MRLVPSSIFRSIQATNTNHMPILIDWWWEDRIMPPDYAISSDDEWGKVHE